MKVVFAQTSLVAMTDHQLTLKNIPQVKAPPTQPAQPGQPAPAPAMQTLQGQWKNLDGKYQLTFSGGADVLATVEGDRLSMSYEGTGLAFTRED